MYEQCKVLQARFDIIKTIKNKEDWVVSKFRDWLADFLIHPKTTQILGVIKFLKSPKGFWSVAFLPTVYIISQFTQLSKADVAQRHIEQSEYFIEKLFWQIALKANEYNKIFVSI